MKTKKYIKKIALEMIAESGVINVTRRGLCERAEIPDGSFFHVTGCTFTDFITDLNNDDSKPHKSNKKRNNPTFRRKQILNIAVNLSKTKGYHKLTRDEIAVGADIAAGLVSHYFGTMIKLRRDIIREAITQKIPEIIAQGLANNDDHAKKAPTELKRQALDLISNY